MSITNNELFERLANIVGQKRVRTNKMEMSVYSHDLAPLPKEAGLAFKVIPDAVVRPKSAHEISDIMKLACEENIPVVPRGAATWGLSGAVPSQGGIVLDMTTMNKVLRVDKDNLEVEVEAGAVWQNVHDAALERGLLIPSHPSSIHAATIAGWINTGGIGYGTYKYGSIGNNIRNMEVVLPEGQIINTGFNKVSDHMSGYNLNGLFVGSEGTLGVITKVTIQAYPAPEVLKPMAYQFNTLYEAIPFLMAVTRSHVNPLSISIVDEKHMVYLDKMGKHTPGKGALVNIALEGSAESVKVEEDAIDAMLNLVGGKKLPDDVGSHEWDERAYEFRMREVGLCAIPGEILVPLTKFDKVLDDIYELIESMGMEGAVMGTMADRNSVTLLPYYIFNDKKIIKSLISLAYPKKLGDIGFKHDGRPLGFGLFFASNLPKIRGQGAEVMFDIKTVLDPHNVLNPGKLVEGVMKYGIPIPGFAQGIAMDVMAGVKKVLPKDKNYDKKAEEFKASEGAEH
ncbi:MAG: FAD-binding oxidoreductase [Thermoplasmata archaeon]|nr:FAD-binding oxidoreductase [Thermoplasmata archaeon]